MANTSIAQGFWRHPIFFGGRVMFYAVTPNETSFAKIEEVPKYVDQAVPYFIGMIALEMIINLWRGDKKRLPRWDDAYSSLAAGVLSLLPLILMRNIEISAFIYLHDNYRITSLDWDSPVTWWCGMLGVDFCYYWVHRYAHEINFMWAAHQVHHSSEDYNLSTALRQSVLQRYSSWIFYLPMAFFIPPSVFVVHIQFNLVYQFWIHTEVIDNIGPLEYILNTASHHRVHHGRNRYCIDKNYGGTLIIWDRMFGTFAAEQGRDEIAYGLVHTLDSWDPIYTQLCHWKYILQTAWSTPGLLNKLYVFIKGPGWSPGKPRLGVITDIPDIKGPVKKYSTTKGVSLWMNLYLLLHFALAMFGRDTLNAQSQHFSLIFNLLTVFYIIWNVTNIGYFYEKKSYAAFSELLRCSVYLAVDSYLCMGGGSCSAAAGVVRVVKIASAAVMLVICAQQMTNRKKVD